MPLGTQKILGMANGLNMNSTADQAIAMPGGLYIIRRIVIANPSLSLTLAAGGIYTAASKAGTAIVSAAQLYSALTGATKFLDLTLAAILGTDTRTENTLYFALTTAQGAAATADIRIFGEQIS